MGYKDLLQLFNNEIEKIVAGEAITQTSHDELDEEDKELLILAELLHGADFSKDSSLHMKVEFSKTSKSQELDDADLDLVAGGRNSNAVLAKDDKGKN